MGDIDAAHAVIGHRANAALNLATEKQVQYWAALIIAICAEQGETQIYTEDAPSAPKLLGGEVRFNLVALRCGQS